MFKEHNSKDYNNVPDLKKEIMQLILDNFDDEIFVINSKKQVLYVNDASERHYGMKPEEIIGKYSEELLDLCYCDPLITPIVWEEKRKVTLEQTTRIGKKIQTTAIPILNKDKSIEYVIYYSKDITKLEEMKKELKLTRDLLAKNTAEKSGTKNDGQSFSPNSTVSIVAESEAMKEVLSKAERVMNVDSTVLILGESGTGKGVLARYIHDNSSRKKDPFIAINCAAIPEELLEAELFGYEAGSFTGAKNEGKIGFMELASEGTLFLDEISELSPKLQAKLLHVIQDKQFFKVGGRKLISTDARIITATNRDLKKRVEEGLFREDLYFRLNVISIEIPSIRERKEDIPPLIEYFLDKFNSHYSLTHEISDECMEKLRKHIWKGNIRELENLIERLVVMTEDEVIDVEHLPRGILDNSKYKIDDFKNVSLDGIKEEIERDLILKAYEKCGSSRKVAKMLSISQSRASRLIYKYISG
ncbi:PAS domain S-box-containing protein [Dethiosulfatibacter aminovorans DSM 17477]|uniref:HTH-type transcriptional regulatory protein TyrR n=1 Tax=Dethiosulfatibacter aminovorans DSM 17477 TaxID=1121476 RepID=A0A1M6M436_9FIRM|nr:sigma 54-interacting transcriptional regulator [Dethiosulfatibacter aminovorans]SHJ78191.1 PAS domain S-box-containing protein [Dethiosulfatibacter aminovorans DSM 17477]